MHRLRFYISSACTVLGALLGTVLCVVLEGRGAKYSDGQRAMYSAKYRMALA